MHKVDVYDFDGTIYNGDSSLDFFLFCLGKNKKLIRFLPKLILFFIGYCFKIISIKKFKEKFFSFIRDIDNKELVIRQFWHKNNFKINNYFIENMKNKKEVYVISASPEFLLQPYLKQFNNVKLIATNVTNNGKIIGENCKGKEKLKLLLENTNEIKIENFYSDSLSDLPLVEIASNSFHVSNGKVYQWDTEEIKKKNAKKTGIHLSILFSIFYIIIGILITYNYDFSETYDLLFDLDTARVISDMSNIFGNHYRLTVHPLFVLLYQPVYYVVHGLVLNKMLALIIISSFVTSISIMFLYCLFSLYNDNKKIKILLVLCYGFSFSNYIFTSGIELYNVAVVFLIGLLYFFANLLKKSKINTYDYLILIILGLLTMAITVSNYVIFLICNLILLLSKKVKFKNIFIINLIIVISFLFLNYFQNYIWHNTPTFLNATFSEKNDEGNYIDFSVNTRKIKNVIKNDYYNSLISSDVYLNENMPNKMILFKDTSKVSIVFVTLFLIQIVILLIRNFKKNIYLNTALMLALVFNTCFHIFYGNGSTFLYSLHFLYLLITLYAVNLFNEKNKIILKISEKYIMIFIFIEIAINSFIFLKILKICNGLLKSNELKNILGLRKEFIFIIVILILIYCICYFIYLLIKNHNKIKVREQKIVNMILIVILFIIIETIFVGLETTPVYKKILWKTVGSNSSDNVYIDMDYKIFKKKYKKEINSYLDYANEYKKFINKYDCTLNYDLSNYEFFLFGLGNRKKILFKENSLVDIETKKILYKFDVSNVIVIPNEYMVLLLTKNNEYIKIYENKNGVYIQKNNKSKLIKGTSVKLKLYNFKNQNYKNMKKVLYHEILFNIKNNKIYPNIMVYDSPWYRDAAITSMVLKQTNNESLIKKWNITTIYDKQNKGDNEADNLGEVLYILSVQGNTDSKLIQKIEEEAEKNANENKNGYYIEGNTDFSHHARYQNMWYSFGMDALGKRKKYNYTKTKDSYSATAWWSSDVLSGDLVNASSTKDYPYLSWAQYHTNHSGITFVNANLYPLSWEKNASEANYNAVSIINEYYVENKISPTHTWTASELLLFLLDETGNLKKI